MNIEYWEKITREAIDRAIDAREGSDTSMYDWIDELSLRIKEHHNFNKRQMSLPILDDNSPPQRD